MLSVTKYLIRGTDTLYDKVPVYCLGGQMLSMTKNLFRKTNALLDEVPV
jgi:hypothetical protein